MEAIYETCNILGFGRYFVQGLHRCVNQAGALNHLTFLLFSLHVDEKLCKLQIIIHIYMEI